MGFSDASAVVVLDAATLAQAYAPDTGGLGPGSLNALTWSRDGRVLSASGTCADATVCMGCGNGPSRAAGLSATAV